MENNWKFEHIGLTVGDVDKAVEFFRSLGIEFGSSKGVRAELQKIDDSSRVVHGKPAPDIRNIGAVTYLGPIRFALTQPVSGESVQKEYLEEHGDGINHLGFVVDDLEKEAAGFLEQGVSILHTAKWEGGGGCYYLDLGVGDIVIELLQP